MKKIPRIDKQEKDAKLHIKDLTDEDCIHKSQNGGQVKENVAIKAHRIHLDRGLIDLPFS
jgi:hypothetical protein